MSENEASHLTGIRREEFLDLLWRLEEMLIPVDNLRSQIGACGEQCEDDEGLCPACCDVFAMAFAEEERLEGDKDFNDVRNKLKKACYEDKTGEYQTILDQLREGKVIH